MLFCLLFLPPPQQAGSSLFVRQVDRLLDLLHGHGGQLLRFLDFELAITGLIIDERVVVGQLIAHLQIVR
jgi:hypothetical protein